jgi:hypothetical protein
MGDLAYYAAIPSGPLLALICIFRKIHEDPLRMFLSI